MLASSLVLALAPAAGWPQSAVGDPQLPLEPSSSPFGTLDLSGPSRAPAARLPELVGKPMPANEGSEPATPPRPAVSARPDGPVADQASRDDARPLAPDEAARLKAKARAALQVGDVAVARALLNAVAMHRDPEAAFLLAQTYDTRMLSQWGAIGVEANQEKASWFYERARQDGYAAEPVAAGAAEVRRAPRP